MKIGIVTIQNAYNYGSTLQAYALQQFLCDMGHDAVIIEYQNKRLNEIYHFCANYSVDIEHIIRGHIRSGILNLLEKKKAQLNNVYNQVSHRYEKYRKKYLLLSEQIFDGQLESLLKYDVLIAGSDQVWNVNITNGDPIYYLKIPYFQGVKIAYAASGDINGDMSKIDMIREFDYISVREERLRSELENYLEKKIEKVCDPTLLIRSSVWKKQVKLIDENYIFAYLMWDEPIVLNYLEELSHKKGLPVAILHRTQKYVTIKGKKYFSTDPGDFLSLVANADYVVSNSFHGTVFSVLFEKQFLSFVSGDRIHDFLNTVGMLDRTIQFDYIGDIDSVIDWEKKQIIIEQEVHIAKKFLLEALKEPL